MVYASDRHDGHEFKVKQGLVDCPPDMLSTGVSDFLSYSVQATKYRRQQNMPQTVDSLRVQIQNVERTLLECRRHIELLTGQTQNKATNTQSGYGNWGWMGFINDRRKRSLRARRYYYNYYNYNYWNNYQNELRNTLNTRTQEYNQCKTRLQSIRAQQEELKNKQQLAASLLKEIEAGTAELKRCVVLGGRTNVDIPTIDRYIAGGGIVQQAVHQTAAPRTQAPARAPMWWWYYDDRRRSVVPSNFDWSQILTQRQQWKSFEQTVKVPEAKKKIEYPITDVLS
ncbi:formin BNR1-like isoform X1 [Biomphalaria pfeifferi]|uniref:Formin BNR1-like isoform X1 n=1 Tax=Biomphalaria pfeifferi TaxID=112525 RepID=A0AAD8C562_BIOPF|nr:formin BNR1-like isoform X1 [Biomphalaria pfeifferi]